MINFTVGPVQSSEEVRVIGAQHVPYFRTEEFSSIMKECEALVKKFAKAEEDARVVFITGSGTASMEASVINTLTSQDKVLIVNGGSFGQRFVEICTIHDIPYTEIRLEVGHALKEQDLKQYENKGYTAFLVNKHETSTGVHYDMDMIGRFCKRNNLFLIVDAISSFLADDFNMTAMGAGIMITGSQKALACPPGMSLIVLSRKALQRVAETNPHSLYFDIKDALKNGERGQTPFTPAVGTLLQIHARLKEIEANGGADVESQRIAHLAHYFRERIKDLPFEIVSESLSNAVTPLHPLNVSAYSIFLHLKDEYGIWICPNGGELKDTVFRVGHIGYLFEKDYDELINAFKDLQKRHLI